MSELSHSYKETRDKPASTQQEYYVTRDDLPLSCPMPTMVLWNAHPRVFLPIDKTGKEVCPYCGATYILRA